MEAGTLTGDGIGTDASAPSRRPVLPWLTVLFCLLFSLNTMGGWVRLSGSGVAIPHWPVIELADGAKTLLPPRSAEDWRFLEGTFAAHQERLRARITAGELTPANLGRQPRDHDEFRSMFLTEWMHRLLAAVTGLVGLGVVISVMRDPLLRRQVGFPIGSAGALIILQAVLGGALVEQGTNTHWLFLHQGNAGAIMGCTLWAVVRLLWADRPRIDGRSAALVLAMIAGAAVWLQLVTGALVAGSRLGFVGDAANAPLWQGGRTLGWNLLDNAPLHQFLHRGIAWSLVPLLALTAWMVRRASNGARLALAVQVAATFLALQLLLGLVSAQIGSAPSIALAHQALGMGLLLACVLTVHDLLYEPADPLGQAAEKAP